MSKKIKLNNEGIVTKTHAVFQKPSLSIKQTTSTTTTTTSGVHDVITKDFIKEIKDQLVHELASVLLKAGIGAVTKIIHSRDDINNDSDTITGPIKIDDSVFVTEVAIGQVEKGFTEITTTQTTKDETVNTSISKLRSIKKRT
jgi:hypothetical protein